MDGVQDKNDVMTVGERIERIVADIAELRKANDLPYFVGQAAVWAQWVWMVDNDNRREWGLTYEGSPNGISLLSAADSDSDPDSGTL